MKNILFLYLCFIATSICASEEFSSVAVALPLYGAFAKKPNPTDTRAQILGDLTSFLPVMGSFWNIAKLTRYRNAIADLGTEVEKKQTGSFNILCHLAQQAKNKGYGTMSEPMQQKLACSITNQPLIPGIQTLVAALQTQKIRILGYGNQDEKEYECFRDNLKRNHNIDLLRSCNGGIVVYRHYETVSQFSDRQPFLQKNGITVSYKPFANSSFLQALQHHAPDTHLLVAVPSHLKKPSEERLLPGLETVPFETVNQFTELLQNRNILQKISLRDIL